MVPPQHPWLSVECDGQAVIDHEGPTPLYVQVADAIAARIDAGDLPPNRPIPSENEFGSKHGIEGIARMSPVSQSRTTTAADSVPQRRAA